MCGPNKVRRIEAARHRFPRLCAYFAGSRQGGKQLNEDSFFQFTSPRKFVVIGGVYDGHGGLNGQFASNTARDVSLEFFNKHKEICESWTVDEWRKQLEILFDTIHERIRTCFLQKGSFRFVDQTRERVVRNADGNFVNGGTTGTVVVQLLHLDGSSTVISANVGDSSAMLMYPDRSTDASVSAVRIKHQLLTVDHAPENEDEFKRISELPAAEYPRKLLLVYEKPSVPRRYEHPLVWPKDPKLERNPWGHGLHPSNVRYEPATYAVTPKEVTTDSACIAVTRGLGDFYIHQFGMTHKPEIRVIELPPGTGRTVVAVASDGVWDCWKYEDFADYFTAALKKAPAPLSVEEDVVVVDEMPESPRSESPVPESPRPKSPRAIAPLSEAEAARFNENEVAGASAELVEQRREILDDAVAAHIARDPEEKPAEVSPAHIPSPRQAALTGAMQQVLDDSVDRAVAAFGVKHFDVACMVSWMVELV